jgi:hypothetical protein
MANTPGEQVVTTLLLVVLLDGFVALYIHGDVTLENIQRVFGDLLFLNAHWEQPRDLSIPRGRPCPCVTPETPWWDLRVVPMCFGWGAAESLKILANYSTAVGASLVALPVTGPLWRRLFFLGEFLMLFPVGLADGIRACEMALWEWDFATSGTVLATVVLPHATVCTMALVTLLLACAGTGPPPGAAHWPVHALVAGRDGEEEEEPDPTPTVARAG